MKYSVKETEAGKFHAIIENPSFEWKTVFTFTREEDAQAFINSKKAESAQALAGIVTISEYFGKVGA